LKFTLRAPAKINWFLRVTGKRSDGYHQIISLMEPISLYDTLRFSLSERLRVSGDPPIPDGENLIYRSASLIREYGKVKSGASIEYKKGIPMQAGLGGGSSDAAATLLGLDRLWRLDLSREDLIRLGSLIGSDVPFFIERRLAIVTGRGEIVKPLGLHTKKTILLIKPPFGVSTGVVYRNLNTYRAPLDEREVIDGLLTEGDRYLSKIASNDLEAPAFHLHPELGEIKKGLTEAGALVSLLSGSGSTVFGLFSDRKSAKAASERFSGYWRKIVETV